MDASAWQFWAALIVSVIFGGGGLATILMSIAKWALNRWLGAVNDLSGRFEDHRKEEMEQLADVTEKHGKLADNLRALGERVAALEARAKDTPSSEAFHELSNAITALNGHLNVVAERLKGVEKLQERIEATVDRQERHLLESGR